MRINADGSTDFLGIVRFLGDLQIDATGILQTKGYRTKADNVNFHQFTVNSTSNAAVYINQVATSGPILRLSSGTATANQNVKFTVENNGNLGIGTTTPAEKLVLYNADTTQTFILYGNSRAVLTLNRGFVTGVSSSGAGMVWQRDALPISLGTYNKERMRINADGSTDWFGSIRSASGGFQIDTTGLFQAKGYRTKAGNLNWHQLSANNTTGAVFINQEAATGPILRLSSGTANANQNVKFTVENDGSFGIGTTNIAEKEVLYNSDTTQTYIQYGNTRSTIGANRGFVTGVSTTGAGMIWHREGQSLSFGTYNKERLRINADGTIDVFGTIRFGYGGFQIDTTGLLQAKYYRTKADNMNWNQFTANNTSGAVFINQVATSGPILRLSSGTANVGQNVRFTVENDGSFGIGTTNIAEKEVLYNSDTTQTYIQYGNTRSTIGANRGFVTGVSNTGAGMVWQREGLPLSFGTYNKERMRINADGTTDWFGSVRSASGGYQIDTTGIFQSKGYRSKTDNLNYHQFITNTASDAAVYINQVTTSGPILRLSSGTANVNQNVKFSFENSGNLGIGTTAPAEKISLYTGGNVKVATQYGNGTGSGFTVGMESNGSASIWHTAGQPVIFGTSNAERMRINADGNIGIGTVSPEYKLDVVGNIRAYSVQISTAKTADFVFDADYRLRPLSEVESYIAANKHLPEIAPAAEMKEKGLDMSEMQIKLLQKVEELTLYAIKQQKEIEQQQKEIEELKSQLNEKKLQ